MVDGAKVGYPAIGTGGSPPLPSSGSNAPGKEDRRPSLADGDRRRPGHRGLSFDGPTDLGSRHLSSWKSPPRRGFFKKNAWEEGMKQFPSSLFSFFSFFGISLPSLGIYFIYYLKIKNYFF